MKMNFDLSMRQKQKQVLTTKIIQTINLLQYNTMELQKYIDMQMEENPLLEIDESYEPNEENEINWVEFIKNTYTYRDENEFTDEEKEHPENFIATEQTLKEVLIEQLHVRKLSEQERILGEFIIDFIDDNGYLSLSSEEFSQVVDAEPEMIEKLTDLIKTFEPKGVGARNLAECLKIQVEDQIKNDPKIIRLLDEHLEDMAYNRDRKILKDLDISAEKLEEYKCIIKSLNPRPGLEYGSEEPRYIIPDVFVELEGDEIKIKLNRYQVPRLRINNYYKNLITKSDDAKTVEFVKTRLDSAGHLIKGLLQRESSIERISKLLFQKQIDFLKNGEAHMKPVTMKEIADELEVHESTVSRTIKNKYVLCEMGVYPLKHFFTSKIATEDGEDVSSSKIKEKIKDYIASEDKQKPLSDQKIADKLKEEGYEISRRTVAKYREESGIMSTRERRQ
ncbi:RNA polymerase factor sigma-54 [Alkalibacter mobilis]|uniref:RNA polymerase factor sigma-54 n=1 Tax=Alkalibacter mobilis TaxID=2787712 RepID=UPI00189DC465|nr:RNA polymerase factor sigma-54 [Alkalibacter mobilis]MBF7097225.1 RNA polymerase factor sigma-54 [Alkalibacter mobilis]